MECNCPDWKDNIGFVNAGFNFLAIHGFGGYAGKPFIFCSWCGRKLQDPPKKKDVTINPDDLGLQGSIQ